MSYSSFSSDWLKFCLLYTSHNNSLYGLSDFEIVRFILFPPSIEFYYQRANAGSNFAAFNAGNNPPNNAVSTDTATATTATLIG